MSESSVIPLFPLALVVFPGQDLPLHIFEPRYKTMLADCRVAAAGEESLPFGISLGQDTTVHSEVGCSVIVEKILNRYEDGRLDIIAVGQERYRVVETYQERPYLTAAVEFFADEEELVDAGLLEQVQVLYGEMLDLIEDEAGTQLDKSVPQESFQLGLTAGLPLEMKQQLLEMTSENQRLQTLGEHFEKLIPVLRERQEEKRRVQSNGRTRRL